MPTNPNQKPGFQQNQNGQTKDVPKKSFTHKAGDVIERVGEAVKSVGADKLGNAIYKAGNKIEHSDENK